MRALRWIGVGCAAGSVLLAVLLAAAETRKPAGESERKVKEAQVPKAALDALRNLASEATLLEFAEEIEHGHTFYEGSWTGPHGNVDALVTASGDVVEIEEIIPAEKAPATVRTEATKAAGDGARFTIEKKTLLLYEVHFKKDGKGHELILRPDGRKYDGAGAEGAEGAEGEAEEEGE